MNCAKQKSQMSSKLKLKNIIFIAVSLMTLSIKMKKIRILTLLVLLLLLVPIIDPVLAQDDKVKEVKELTGGKINKVKVIYATDGYMVDSSGSSEYFILAAVQINKRGSPKTEWQDPLLYFEFKNKRTFAGMGAFEVFSDGLSVKRMYTSSTDFNYAKYNRSKYAAKGLSTGATPHEFELDFIFNENGTIDIQKSSMGVIPDNYKTGRKIKSMEPTDEYYKKGSKTEKAAVIRDENGSIVNTKELGEPVTVEGTAMTDEVCFDYLDAISPVSSPISIKENGEEYNYEEEQRKEKEKDGPSYQPDEGTQRADPPAAPDMSGESHPDPKEIPVKILDKKPDAVDPYKSTGLCSIYKIQEISHSQPLPNAEVLGGILKPGVIPLGN